MAGDFRELLLAGLLHDASKGPSVGLWHRVAWSLGEHYGPVVERPLAHLPGFRGAFDILRDHAARSATLARAAGCTRARRISSATRLSRPTRWPASRPAGLAQIGEDGQDPPIVVGAGSSPSFEKIVFTCASTVFSPIASRSQIAAFVRPSAIRARTCRSRSVSVPMTSRSR